MNPPRLNEAPVTQSVDTQKYPRRLGAGVLALAALIAGVLYYAVYRQQALPSLFAWLPMIDSLSPSNPPFGFLNNSIPSLTHAFASVLMLHALLPNSFNARMRSRLFLLTALVGFECLWGTVDTKDLLAIGLGTISAELIAWGLGLFRFDSERANHWAMASLVTVSGLMAAGTSSYDYQECARYSNSGSCEEYKKPAEPIYMSYQRLREAVRLEPARPPDRLGRMYLYRDFIFLNERNEGIHIIDNRDSRLPVNVGFLRIPGNTEIEIRDNYLYADSYVDLITLDLDDPSNVQLVSRQPDVFPFDAFQNIPYNISLSGVYINPSFGVVVGYDLQ